MDFDKLILLIQHPFKASIWMVFLSYMDLQEQGNRVTSGALICCWFFLR